MPSERWIASRDAEPQEDLNTRIGRLRKQMARRNKMDVIDLLVDLAVQDCKLLQRLEARFMPTATVGELESATRHAIAVATDFDERQINDNFDYDSGAYEVVQRNLAKLIEIGQLDAAMELALVLMRKGSYQVEMSDEGMMTDDIEACMNVVIEGVSQSDLPPNRIANWCDEISRADRVGFICNSELMVLRESHAPSR